VLRRLVNVGDEHATATSETQEGYDCSDLEWRGLKTLIEREVAARACVQRADNFDSVYGAA